MMNPIDQFSILLDQTWATQARDFFDRLYDAWGMSTSNDGTVRVELSRQDFEAFRDMAEFAAKLAKQDQLAGKYSEMLFAAAGLVGWPCQKDCKHDDAEKCDLLAQIKKYSDLSLLEPEGEAKQ